MKTKIQKNSNSVAVLPDSCVNSLNDVFKEILLVKGRLIPLIKVTSLASVVGF